jgi:hypothetical protein
VNVEVGYAQKVAKKGLQSYIPQERKKACQTSIRRRLEAPHDEKTSLLVIKISPLLQAIDYQQYSRFMMSQYDTIETIQP